MNHPKISRKKFFKSGALLLTTPYILLNISSYSYLLSTQESDFGEMLSKQKVYPVNKFSGRIIINNVTAYLVPSSTISRVNEQFNRCCVVKRVQVNKNIKIQTAVVEIHGAQGKNLYISGIKQNDLLFLNPSTVIQELSRVNRKLVRERFMSIINDI